MDPELGERDLSVSGSFADGRDGYKIAARPKFYTEQFERVCPYYIAFGMTYEQFWDGDVEIAKAYRKAHEIKNDELNQQAWLQGFYVYHAIGALAPALKAFSKGRAQEYMKYPIGHENDRADRPIEKAKVQDHDDSRAKAWMEMWAINFNAKFDEKLAEGGETDG